MSLNDTQRLVVDRFFKLAHFIPCNKTWMRLILRGTSLNFSKNAHPQTNGQTKMVNCTLGNMIRCLRGDKPGLWDVSLAQAEFTYNSAVDSSTGFSPFEVVYKTSPSQVVDLVDLASKKNVKEIRCLKRFNRLKLSNQLLSTRKLQQKKYGPYKILRKINENAYVVDLPNVVSISKTFNVCDIYEFHPEEETENENLRTSSSKVIGNDEDKIDELKETWST
ncbi:RNA-directed DNA polymerase [Tanacetum coccineum]